MGERIAIDGHDTWVEQRGDGAETVLLLHGGMSNSDALLDGIGAILGATRRIVAFDRRGHGHTADTADAFHYDTMATETIGVLEQVVGGPAHLVGWSDGGIVGLLVAMRRPDLVDRLVVIGANFHYDGIHPLDFDPESELAVAMMEGYGERSPDGPEHFTDVAAKFMTMATTEPSLTTGDLAVIAAPTLVMAGDDDLIRLDHTCALYEALSIGQLAIVPGTSHALPIERPELVAALIATFLDGPAVAETLMAVRRASGPVSA